MEVSFTGSNQISNVAKKNNNAPKRALTSAADKVKLEKSTKKEFENLMPRMIKIISKFSKLQGEVPNIIINALGTGLVAPIFIKYNFLSKTDEDTRTYSAWRQPVSAVLAVITQAGMITPFNHLIWKMNNNGEFCGPNYNTTAFPDAKYIQEQLKKDGCKLTGKELEDLAKQKYNEKIDALVDKAIKDNTIKYTMFNGKNHTTNTVADAELRDLLDSVAQKMKKETEETITRYEKEKPEHQIQRGEYLRHDHDSVRTILTEAEEQIKAGKSYTDIKKGLKSKLKELKRNNADSELKAIVKQLSKQLDNPTLQQEIEELKVKCNAFSKCRSTEDVQKVVQGRLAKRKAELKNEQSIIEELIKGINQGKEAPRLSIGELHKIANKLKDNQFVYDVVQKHISNVKANIKGLNQIIGIAVGVAMLPLTCCLLNYIYPRFMDTFFPHLSNKKKPKTDDYFVKVNGTVPMEAPEDKKGGKL